MCVSHNPRNKSIQSVEDDYWKHTLYPILELILDSQEFQEQTENMDRLIKEIDNVRDDIASVTSIKWKYTNYSPDNSESE